LAARLQHACHLLMDDAKAHESEHAVEVELPFLQRTVGTFRFVPIAIGVSRYAALETLGHGMAEAVKGSPGPVMMIASSDMNHYEPDDVTRVKDRLAINQMLALDPAGLYETVRKEDISMCGYGPAVATLTAAKGLGASRAELVRYATSADAGGERSSVVGYAGLVFS
jgi:MEMO1 family protein